MKIEIEIKDEDIRKSVEGDIARAIQMRNCRFGQESEVRKIVNDMWEDIVPDLVRKRLSDSEYLNEMIDEEVKRQIKSRIAKLVKAAEGK